MHNEQLSYSATVRHFWVIMPESTVTNYEMPVLQLLLSLFSIRAHNKNVTVQKL